MERLSDASRPTKSSSSSQLFFHCDPSWFEGVGSGYTYCLENYYLATQSATGALCATAGDVIAQWSERKEEQAAGKDEEEQAGEYDPVRTFHYFLKGLGGGIMWAYWFDLSEPLSNSLTHSMLGTTSSDVQSSIASMDTDILTLEAFEERATCTMINIFLEQFFVSPLLFTFWDIPLPALLRGTPLRQLPTQVQTKLGPLLVANAKVWTLVNLVTYNIPVEYRVLYASCADILWQSINVGITSQEVPPSSARVTTVAAAAVASSSSAPQEESSLLGLWPPNKSSSRRSKSSTIVSPTNTTTLFVTSAMVQRDS